MSEPLSVIYVARHGETAWSLSGQHTGITDLPLTEGGERNAARLGERLKGLPFTKVFTSPCSARAGPASWLASEPWRRSIVTCTNGTTVSMKAVARPRSLRNVPVGKYFATVVPAESRRIR